MHDIKYVDLPLTAASIPIETDKCVLPTPGIPINIIFSFSSINLKYFKSRICCLLMSGWNEKSKSSNFLMKGKWATVITALSDLSFLNFNSKLVNSYSASTKSISFLLCLSIYELT